MKVRICFTVDVDYAEWSQQAIAAGNEVSPAQCRNNLQALAEEQFASVMDNYVSIQWITP
jgi:hypothetical protein